MKYLAKLIIILLLFIQTLNASSELKKVTLQLSWFDQFQFAGYYIAKEKGFYKELGLDVEIKPFQFGIDIPKEVDNNTIDFAIGRENLILERASHKNIVALYALFQTSPLVLLSTKESQINSFSDFRNKKVMSTMDDASEVSLKAMLTSQKIKLSDVNCQKHTHNINDLITKKTDVISAYISKAPFILQEKGIGYNIFEPKEYGFDMYSDLLYTNQQLISNDPNLVKAFKQASLKGWEYGYSNIEESAQLIYDKYNTQNLSKKELIFEGKELKKLSFYNTQTLGNINKNKLKRISDLYNVMGLLHNQIDFAEFVFEDQLNEIMFTDEEKRYLKNKKSLTVANLTTFPPFNFYENEQPKGYTVDYLKLLQKYIGINIEFISNKSWDEYLNMLKNKEIDLIPHVAITKDREEYLDFTNFNHIKYITGIAIDKNSNIKSIKDLENNVTAVTKNSFIHTYFKNNFPNYSLFLVDSTYHGVEAVSSGNADAVIGSLPALDHYIQKNWLTNIKTIIVNDLEESTVVLPMAVSKGNSVLKSILEKVDYAISYSEIVTLKEKWMTSSSKSQVKNNLTKEERTYLKQKKKILMCVLPDWLPFEQIDKEGNHKGIGADLMKIVSTYIDTPIELFPTQEWSESLQNIKDRKCDILPVAMSTPNRRKYMNFTKPYVKEPFVVATKNDQLFIKDSSALSNKKIGMVKSYAFVEVLKNRNLDIQIVNVKNTKEGLERVSDGELFGYIETMPTIGYAIQKYSMFDLKIAGKLEFDVEISTASRNDEILLNSIMQKALNSITPENKRTIIGKWIEIKVAQEFDYSLLWKFLLLFSLIILAILYKQYISNKSVNEMTELIDSTIEAILISKKGICIDANKSALIMFELDSKNDIIGTNVLDIIAEESLDLSKQGMLLDNNDPCEAVILKKSKEKFPALIRSHKLKGINAMATSLIDITHLKKLESQSKMASMGEMIGNIAHQWRQPLSVISTAATGIVVQKEYGLLNDVKLIDTCNTINENAQYLSKTIDDFRNFIKGDREKRVFNVKDTIDSFLNLVEGSIKTHNIQIIKDIQEEITIDGFENEIIQCLINIFNNAKDALNENHISSENKLVFITTSIENNNVLIKIRDNGGGID
ncbi:MAG: transporter substrate-binding domain-containing protein, partial [Arcobacteraceae bacterium]